VRGAGRERAQRNHSLRAFRVGPGPVQLFFTATERAAHPKGEGRDERSRDEKRDERSALLEHRDVARVQIEGR